MLRNHFQLLFRKIKNTIYQMTQTQHFDFIQNSKILQNWPTLLLASTLILAILHSWKWLEKKKLKSHKKLDGEEHIAVDFKEETTEQYATVLRPALDEKPHIAFVPGNDLNPNGARKFYDFVKDRRSIRQFSKKSIDISVIEDCIRAAGTAPSGAHTEPWTFVVVEKLELKQSIRDIVEHEEQINYTTRMRPQWVTDLRPLHTNATKQYLEDAPYLLLVFKQTHGQTKDGRKKLHYYNEISTSISTGILLCALQAAGLCSLVTTPLNCGTALRMLLKRPDNEKLLILLAVGYAADECMVPDLKRKPLKEIMLLLNLAILIFGLVGAHSAHLICFPRM